MTVGYVSVSAKVDLKDLSDEDVDVVGSYRFECSELLEGDVLANALLNNLHNQVPINILEDFEIKTYNESEFEIQEGSVTTTTEMTLKDFSPLHNFDG
jgi:hypothetical protein